MASNSHGNKNEKHLSDALNNKKFKDLSNLNLRTFIKEIHPTATNETLILCPHRPGSKKQDLEIIIDNFSYFVSVKTGSGNSIHQERLEPFIEMLKDKYFISDSIANSIKFFIWGDGTYDGSGLKENRLSSSELIKKYPEVIREIQMFFDQHRIKLLTRFLITGRFHDGHINYIYYGTTLNGVWCSAQDALNFHKNINISSRGIKLGNTTFQSWNRCIKGGKKEKYRDTIQLKWGSIKSDIAEIRKQSNRGLHLGTQEGDSAEYDFCRELNKNKNPSNQHWKFLSENLELPKKLDNIYAVKVSKKVFSSLANKKVFPKTDLYLIEADLDPNFLLIHNHLLDENILDEQTLNFIPKSGISIKRPDSKKYAIQKLSITSFNALLNKPILGAGASLYCSEENMFKNKKIIDAWGVTYNELLELNLDNKNLTSTSVDETVRALKKIKKHSNEKIKEIIKSNSNTLNLIFKGSGNFEEPYVAHFIFIENTLKLNNATDFSVTTGSGRTKGSFSIEIKPK